MHRVARESAAVIDQLDKGCSVEEEVVKGKGLWDQVDLHPIKK